MFFENINRSTEFRNHSISSLKIYSFKMKVRKIRHLRANVFLKILNTVFVDISGPLWVFVAVFSFPVLLRHH